jgi:AraC-like DNA-binding protein
MAIRALPDRFSALPLDGPEPVDTPSAHRHAVERVIAAIRAAPGESLALEEMAEIACLSPFHFSRVFRKVAGTTPGAYLTAVRMDWAKRLLLSTDLSVTEVCFETGFSSLGTFTSRFSNLVGVTPSRLRQLPEALEPVLDQAQSVLVPGDGAPPERAAVSGTVHAPGLAGAVIFVGLFPDGIPQRIPMAGDMLAAPGDYRIAWVPDGRYRLLAAAAPLRADPDAWLAPGPQSLVGGGQEILVRNGMTTDPADIHLRPYLPTDPPILVTPFMLLQRRLQHRG